MATARKSTGGVAPRRLMTRAAMSAARAAGALAANNSNSVSGPTASAIGTPLRPVVTPPSTRSRRMANKRIPESQETTVSFDSQPSALDEVEDNHVEAGQRLRKTAKGDSEKASEEAEQTQPAKKKARMEKPPPPIIYPDLHLQKGYSRGDQVIRIVSWNVASLRSVVKKGYLNEYLLNEKPDVLCLQETKMTEKALEDMDDFEGYHVHWNHSEKKGYSGVAIFERDDLDRLGVKIEKVEKGCGEETADAEGRVLTAYFSNGLALVNCYVPNSGSELKRLDYRTNKFEPQMRSFLNTLQGNYNVIYTGDLNCAHEEIDIHNSKGNQKSAGHTPEERKSFGVFLESGNGWTDAWRSMYAEYSGFTYYSRRFGERMKNAGKGWRLDYFVIDKATWDNDKVRDLFVRPDVTGSDHYPLVLDYQVK